MSTALGLGQRRTELLDADVEIGGGHLAYFVSFLRSATGDGTRHAAETRRRLLAVDALKVDAHLVVFGRPGIGKSVAAFAAAAFAA